MKNPILLVDDESHVLSSIKRALFDEPLEIYTAESGENALKIMASETFKVVMSDERMPGMSGAEFLAKAKDLYPNTIRIMLTGHATIEAAINAVNSGEIYRFFSKPWNDYDLKFAIKSAIEKYDLETENSRLLATLRQQALEIRILEKRYPGISRVEKDSKGVFVLPDIPDEEIDRMMCECEKEFRP